MDKTINLYDKKDLKSPSLISGTVEIILKETNNKLGLDSVKMDFVNKFGKGMNITVYRLDDLKNLIKVLNDVVKTIEENIK